MSVGVADARVNAVSSYVGAGLTYTGLLSGRAEDQLGIAVATARFGQEFLSAQRAEGNAWHTSEVNLELTYRFPVTPWLTLQPDLQYVVNPGGNSALDDALVIGLRFELAASFSE
jgi:porin